jgi:hypothetical protein
MANTNKIFILQASIFVLAWTLLWPLVNLIFPIKPLTTMASKPTLGYGIPIFLLSLLGSLISYYLVHAIARLKAKRIVLSVFWSCYWLICVGLQTLLSMQHANSNSSPHTGPVPDQVVVLFLWSAIILAVAVTILAYAAVTILQVSIVAYLASFVPGLEPKNHTGHLL